MVLTEEPFCKFVVGFERLTFVVVVEMVVVEVQLLVLIMYTQMQ
jgi:hypothetical protein